MRSFTAPKIAGLLSLLAALVIAGAWFILLFVAQPENSSVFGAAAETAEFLLFDQKSSRLLFMWLATVPVVSTAIGVSYLAGAASSKRAAIVLFFLSSALGLCSFALLTWSFALWFVLPCYWGFICVRQA